MIKDLSLDPDKSMFGLSHNQYTIPPRVVSYIVLFEGSCQAGDPATVPLKGAADHELLSHVGWIVLITRGAKVTG